MDQDWYAHRISLCPLLAQETPPEVTYFVISWMNDGGWRFDSLLEERKDDIVFLQDAWRFAYYLVVTPLMERIQERIGTINDSRKAKEQKAKEAAMLAAGLSESPKYLPRFDEGFCAKCNKDEHMEDDCVATWDSPPRCHRCWRLGHEQDVCDVKLYKVKQQPPTETKDAGSEASDAMIALALKEAGAKTEAVKRRAKSSLETVTIDAEPVRSRTSEEGEVPRPINRTIKRKKGRTFSCEA